MKKTRSKKVLVAVLTATLMLNPFSVHGNIRQVEAKEAETEIGIETAAETEADTETEPEAEAGTETAAETEADTKTEPEAENGTETVAENETEPENGTEAEAETETAAETKAETEPERETETEQQETEQQETEQAEETRQPFTMTLDAILVAEDIWVSGFVQEDESLTYTGKKITQNIQVYHKDTLLKEKRDYVLTYRNNREAAAYNTVHAPSVTITMKGQYTGSRKLYFTIAPKEIEKQHTLGYEQTVSYEKTLQLPEPVLYVEGNRLLAERDFVCDYSSLPKPYTAGDAYEEGAVYEYTVKGVGNYRGEVTMQLVVLGQANRDFAKADVVLDKRFYAYKGQPLTEQDVKIESLSLGGEKLEEGLYTYKVDAKGAGVGSVEVYPSEAGREAGYRGVQKLKINLVGDRRMQETDIGAGWQDTLLFSKKELEEKGGFLQKQSEVLVFGKGENREDLTEGVDYTVRYSNHRKAGTATVTFSGIGRYRGTIKKTYTILPCRELLVQWQETDEDGNPIATYTKGGAVPQFVLTEKGQEGVRLDIRTDYRIRVADNKVLGKMTCEIFGKGNYAGYYSKTVLQVVAGDIGKATMTVPDKTYGEQPDAWKSAVTIRDVNGRKLMPGVDYDKELVYRYEGMEEDTLPEIGTVIQVTAQGIGNYAGSQITGSYRICRRALQDLVVEIEPQEYTGEEITLLPEHIHLYANGADRLAGKEIAESCYEIIAYRNHVQVGKAQVTLQGVGEYGGTRTDTFWIQPKAYETNRVTEITLAETNVKLGIGNEYPLSAVVSPEEAHNKTVIWTSSAKDIVSVNGEGVLTAKKVGKVTITATAQDTGKQAICEVEVVVIPVTSFSLNTEKVQQKEGTEFQMEAQEVQPSDATYSTILWESADPEIASVDENGKISLHKAGMTVVKARVTAGEREFVRKCLVIVEREGETPPEGNYVTPQMFRTYDESDDTNAFNKALKSLNEECNTVYVPAGTYKINAQSHIRMQSNARLLMSPDAVLQAIGNSAASYEVIYMQNKSNVEISGGQIVGERYAHQSTAGEWGHGIGMYDCQNVQISNVSVSRCWGDGIYIGSQREAEADAGCREVTLTNCNLFDNRRNNLSIVFGDYVTVEGCSFRDANGTAPEFGIDIETNRMANPCEHITISNCFFAGNGQAALGIITAAEDVKVSGCTLYGNVNNWWGTDVTFSDTTIYGNLYARRGVKLVNGSSVNGGTETEDVQVGSFCPVWDKVSLGQYGIDGSNRLSAGVVQMPDSPSGKVLRISRETQGTKEAGYYINMGELLEGTKSVLEPGALYRLEYVVRGTGQWGLESTQTSYYPCAPEEEHFTTGSVTYRAKAADSCKLYVYAVDKTKDMYLEIDSIRIYKVQ